MNRNLDIRGKICTIAAGVIQSSVLYHGLAATYKDIEIWPSLYETHDGWSYYWLVSERNGVTKGLAYVRFRCDTLELQEPIQGPYPQVSWEAVAPYNGPG